MKRLQRAWELHSDADGGTGQAARYIVLRPINR